MKWFDNRRGFSFIEMLMALFVLALIMVSLQCLLQQYRRSEYLITTNRSTEWHQLLKSLELELKDSQEIISDEEVIRYIRNQKHFEICLNQERIYIRPGFHPLMFDVAEWTIFHDENLFFIQIITTEGQVFKGSIVL